MIDTITVPQFLFTWKTHPLKDTIWHPLQRGTSEEYWEFTHISYHKWREHYVSIMVRSLMKEKADE